MQIQHIHFNCVSHFILVLLGHSSALPISSPWLASIHTIPPVMGALFISISKLCLSMTHIQGVGASCASLPLSDNLFHGVVCHQAGAEQRRWIISHTLGGPKVGWVPCCWLETVSCACQHFLFNPYPWRHRQALMPLSLFCTNARVQAHAQKRRKNVTQRKRERQGERERKWTNVNSALLASFQKYFNDCVTCSAWGKFT